MLSVEIIFRPFQKSDMDALYFLDQYAVAPSLRFSYGQLLSTLLDRDVSALVAVIQDPQGKTIKLVGALIIRGEPYKRVLNVLSLVVHPEFRRKKLGSQLLEWAVRTAQGLAFPTLQVPLEAGNPEGEAFLTRWGFAAVEEQNAFFSDPAQGRLWRRTLEIPPTAPVPA